MNIKDSPLELDKDGRAKPVTEAETLLLESVPTGDPVFFPDAPEPAEADGWTDQHTLRATFLRHLCLNPALYAIDPKGVLLYGARITGALDFQAAALTRPLWVLNSRLEGQVDFCDAQTRSLGFVDCHLTEFIADRLSVTGTLKLTGSTINGATRLGGAIISGNLECTDATFTHEGDDAFNADGLKTGGSMFLRKATVTGATRLLGADITGNLECHGATFIHKHDTAFDGNRLKTGGSVFLTKATVTGAIRLVGADITGDLACDGATFTHEGNDAFCADGLKTGGNVFLTDATVTGAIRLLGADITGDLACEGATFTHKHDIAFNAQRLKVGNRFFWRELKAPPQGDVDLTHAHIGDFGDDRSGWPEVGEGYLVLDGLCYDTIGPDTTATTRKKWLARMPNTEDKKPDGKAAFYPQPYEQLIKVLRAAGHDADARAIAMAKQDALYAHLKRQATHEGLSTWWQRWVLMFLKVTAGYGYKPSRALWWSFLFMVLGSFIFEAGQIYGYVLPAKDRVYVHKCYSPGVPLLSNADCAQYWRDYSTERRYVKLLPNRLASLWAGQSVTYPLPEDYVTFHAIAYSIDVFVPILDLQQESSWMPKDGWYRFYMWLHIIAGWVLTTIAVAGFTGLIKKD